LLDLFRHKARVSTMSESHRLMTDPEPGHHGYPGYPGFPGFPDYTRYSGHSIDSHHSNHTDKESTCNGSTAPDSTIDLDWEGDDDLENPRNWPVWKKVIHTAIPAIYTFGLYVASYLQSLVILILPSLTPSKNNRNLYARRWSARNHAGV
jgi:hypothetical protein